MDCEHRRGEDKLLNCHKGKRSSSSGFATQAKADAHQKRVCKQRGFTPELSNSGSRELNAVERFFAELRKTFSNHIFEGIDQVEEYLSLMQQPYFHNPSTIIQLCRYPLEYYTSL